jgi:hypothetical protein
LDHSFLGVFGLAAIFVLELNSLLGHVFPHLRCHSMLRDDLLSNLRDFPQREWPL